jgi:hypothetical protein
MISFICSFQGIDSFLTCLIVHNSFTGGFVVIVLCMDITYPSLVNSFHYSPSSFPLLEMTPTGFNVLYSYMHRKHFNHIHPPLNSPLTSALPLA